MYYFIQQLRRCRWMNRGRKGSAESRAAYISGPRGPGFKSRAPDQYHRTGSIALDSRRLVDLQNSSAADEGMVR
jgi:hypothetical protein